MFSLIDSTYFATFLQITMLNIVMLVSPGPDFAVVTHNSLVYGRKVGLLTAVGITLGELVHLSYIVLGFGSIIASNIWLLTLIKLLGCIYLVYLGIQMILAKPEQLTLNNDLSNSVKLTSSRAVLRGMLTNFLNPKAILFFLSLFSIVVDIDTPVYVLSFYGLSMLLTTLGWFVLVAIFFSNEKLSSKLTSIKHWIERATGSMLIVMSIKLALTHEHAS